MILQMELVSSIDQYKIEEVHLGVRMKLNYLTLYMMARITVL